MALGIYSGLGVALPRPEVRQMAVRAHTVLWLVVVLAVAAGCRRGAGPIIDTTPGPDVQRGTIAGRLEKPAGGGPVAGRLVRAVHSASGQAHEATTNPAGGFTIQVPPGDYRIEVQLLAGEQLHESPDVVSVGPSQIEANLKLVIGPAAAPGT